MEQTSKHISDGFGTGRRGSGRVRTKPMREGMVDPTGLSFAQPKGGLKRGETLADELKAQEPNDRVSPAPTAKVAKLAKAAEAKAKPRPAAKPVTTRASGAGEHLLHRAMTLNIRDIAAATRVQAVEIFTDVKEGLYAWCPGGALEAGTVLLDGGTRLVSVADSARVRKGLQVKVDSGAYEVSGCRIYKVNGEDPDSVQTQAPDARHGPKWQAAYAAELATYKRGAANVMWTTRRDSQTMRLGLKVVRPIGHGKQLILPQGQYWER